MSEVEELSSLFSAVPHEERGLLFEAIYTGKVFSNTRGGLNTKNATRYRGVAELVLTADLETLFGWPGASVFVNAGQMHGRSISAGDVGDWRQITPAAVGSVFGHNFGLAAQPTNS